MKKCVFCQKKTKVDIIPYKLSERVNYHVLKCSECGRLLNTFTDSELAKYNNKYTKWIEFFLIPLFLLAVSPIIGIVGNIVIFVKVIYSWRYYGSARHVGKERIVINGNKDRDDSPRTEASKDDKATDKR